MENEELYDSLDEDTISTISGATIRRQSLIPIRKREVQTLSTLLPLYGKETKVEDIKHVNNKSNRKKTTLNILPSKLKLDNTTKDKAYVDNNSVKKSTKPYLKQLTSTEISLKKPTKSYLSLFRAKIGFPQSKSTIVINDTSRAVDGDESFRSFSCNNSDNNSSEFLDAISNISDSSSFYLKVIEDEKRTKEKHTMPLVSSNFNESKISLINTPVNQFKSISEYTMGSSSTLPTSRSTTFQKPVMEVPLLGGLGPDTIKCKEKLMRLRKQQSYGQKVSNQNRMKMVEVEILKNLKLELKKSTNINNVLQI